MIMKRYLLLTSLITATFCFTSCAEEAGSNPLNGFTVTGISGVKTVNADDYNYWSAASTVHFTNTWPNYGYWSIVIGDHSGYFWEVISGDDNHWRGYVYYEEKDAACNEMIYMDSLSLDITNNESGWNDVVFKTNSFSYEKGSTPNALYGIKDTYYLKTDSAGNINSISVFDKNEVRIFRFKTNVEDDFNSWKASGMPQGWVNGQGRTCLFIMPALYTIFQQ